MITRFAPSPTGPLHLGHAYSALTVWQVAKDLGGKALLRIEDTDSTRCRPEHEAAIYDILHWLGLDWPRPVLRQSDRSDAYEAALETLARRGLIYPCSCRRRQIKEAGARPGWDGLVYPGTCRDRPLSDRKPGDALRLDLAKALMTVSPCFFNEIGPLYSGDHRPDQGELLQQIGDPVLQRIDTGDPAYHLACVVDDAAQGITHVVRGADLWRATFLHVVLQALLGLATPTYHHHDLIRDETGTRLAKIDASRAISSYREDGASPEDIRKMVGF